MNLVYLLMQQQSPCIYGHALPRVVPTFPGSREAYWPLLKGEARLSNAPSHPAENVPSIHLFI